MTVRRKRPANSGTVGVSSPDGFHPLVSGRASPLKETSLPRDSHIYSHEDVNAEVISDFLAHQPEWKPSILIFPACYDRSR